MIPQLFEPWLITESGLRLVFNIATRNAVFTEERIKALEERAGKPLASTRTVTVRDGVAIIPVSGPLFRHASMLTEISGATSYETLAKDFATALVDSSISSIRFYIDSPGGECNGCFEFADAIYRARGKKPIQGFVEGYGCSAAYAIASACDEVVITPATFLGSIGAVMSATDRTKADAQAGELTIEFVSSVSPDKRPDIKTEGGKAIVQGRVDALGDLFVERVARNRGRTTAYVLEHFGQGDVRMGAAAVAAGLADRLSDSESSLAHLAGRPNQQGARMSAITAAMDPDEDQEGDDEECKAKKAKARAAKKAKADADQAAMALGYQCLSVSGKDTPAEAVAVLTLAMESHKEIASLREAKASAEQKAMRVELRQILQAGLAGASPTLSLGKISKGMVPLLRGAPKAAWVEAMGKLGAVTADAVIDAACSVPLATDDLVAIAEYAKGSPSLAAPVHVEPERDAVAESKEIDASMAAEINAAVAEHKRLFPAAAK